MIFGVRANAALFGLIFVLLPLISVANDGDLLARVFSDIALRSQHHVHYEETKHVSHLDEPLISTGQLHYVPPDTITRTQETPYPAEFVIKGTHVSMKKGSRNRSIDISKAPMLQVFSDMLRGVMEGDLAHVEEIAEIDFSGIHTSWTLRLRPEEHTLAKAVREIIFTGQRGNISQIEINESSGDWSVLRISPLDNDTNAPQ